MVAESDQFYLAFFESDKLVDFAASGTIRPDDHRPDEAIKIFVI